MSELGITVQDSTYPVRIFVPTIASTTDVLPSVVVFHGGGDTGERVASTDGFEELAETEGFIVVHPTTPDDGPKWWEFFDDDFPVRDDVAFASTLLDDLEEGWCADPTRTYAFGMSIGGAFAGRLGCEMPERLAGVGAIAHHATTPFCDPDRPMPVIQFNGTADEITPFDGMSDIDSGNPTWEKLRALSVADEFAAAAARRGCAPEPETTTIASDVTVYLHADCDGAVSMARYEVAGGGHTWPGDATAPGVIEPFGYNTADISATAEAWNFFEQFDR